MAGFEFEHNTQYQLPSTLLPHEDPIMLVTGVRDYFKGADGQIERAELFLNPKDELFLGQENLRWMYLPEALAQGGASALYQEAHDAGVPENMRPSPLLLMISEATFGQDGIAVLPGDSISLDVEFKQRREGVFMGRGIAKVGDAVVCDTTFRGALMSPADADAFYDGLPPSGVAGSIADHARNLADFAPGVFTGQPESVWIDSVEVAEDGQSATGVTLPVDYLFWGHAFGEKTGKDGKVVRNATPLYPGVRSIGTAEDQTKAANPETNLMLMGIKRAKLLKPVQKGQPLRVETVFSSDDKGHLVSEFKVSYGDREVSPENVVASGALAFMKIAR
jgi:3-hydroxymyristoyl/3-hydroxydecanoyl-(acyl carrier protein) dehydratase